MHPCTYMTEKKQRADQTRKNLQQQGVARHGGRDSIWGHSEKKLPKLEVRPSRSREEVGSKS